MRIQRLETMKATLYHVGERVYLTERDDRSTLSVSISGSDDGAYRGATCHVDISDQELRDLSQAALLLLESRAGKGKAGE